MMLKDKLPKMPELFLVLMLSEFLMNPQLLLLLMVLIKNLEKKISLSLILVVVLLMFPSLQLIMEFLKLFLLPEILILEEKILIKELWIISLNLLKRKKEKIFLKIKELSKKSREKLKEPRELYHLLMKLKSKLNHSMMDLISLKFWLELDSKNLMLIYSKKLWDPYKLPLMTQDLKKTKLMKSSLLEDLPVSLKLDNLLKISLMVKNLILVLTLMKLLLTEPLFKEELFVVILLKKLNL